VTVVKCEDLPVKDTALMTCDPYVKLQLLPEKQQRVKTRVLRHTRQPVYDEDFTFYGVQPNQLQVTAYICLKMFKRIESMHTVLRYPHLGLTLEPKK